MNDCCKDRFLLGLKHVQDQIKTSYFGDIEDLRAWLNYSIKLLERQKETKDDK